MANDDYKTKWEKFLQEAVREAVKEQLGMTDGEMDDAEQFLAIPADNMEHHCEKCGLIFEEPMQARFHTCRPLLTVATIRTMRAQLLGEGYNGRCDDLTYSDYAFLYDVGISLDNPTGDSL